MFIIDLEKCSGCGTCVAICPTCFKMGENGKAEVTNPECNECDNNEVVSSCAFGAIAK
jgi:ferredoxin